MKVGDKVRVYGEETEIIAMGYDEEGDKIYTVKGSTEDYYEHQIEQMTFHLLRSILYLATEELEKGNRETSAILLYDELVELKELMDSREQLEARWKLTEEERDAIYSDYQELGKELSKLQDKCEELEKTIEQLKKASEEGEHIPRID